jgi:hypothetical protein
MLAPNQAQGAPAPTFTPAMFSVLLKYSLAPKQRQRSYLDILSVRTVRATLPYGYPVRTSNGMHHHAIGILLTCVVHQILCYFSQCTAFLSEVYDDSTTPVLGFFNRFLDPEDQVRSTGTNIRSEHITSIAFIMHPQCKPDTGVRHFGRVAEAIDGKAADWRKEQLYIASSNQFRKGAPCVLKE